jgi:hypothetical protein
VGSKRIVRTYAAAPQARVKLNPNTMVISIASTEPNTLEAAFSAHATASAVRSSIQGCRFKVTIVALLVNVTDGMVTKP